MMLLSSSSLSFRSYIISYTFIMYISAHAAYITKCKSVQNIVKRWGLLYVKLMYTFKLCVVAGVVAGFHHIPIGIPVSRHIGAAHRTTVVPLNSIDDDDDIGLFCKRQHKNQKQRH